MWCYSEDTTKPVISASQQITGCYGESSLQLPKTAVLFYMSSGVEYVNKTYETIVLSEKFPRFLNACPIYQIKGSSFCFLDGGRGAPQAVDTLETLAALGVRTVLTIGMFGAFDTRVDTGDIVVPNRVFVEEGTSLHYYENIAYAEPDKTLFDLAAQKTKAKVYPLVSTDAVYRQTFFKEAMWRKQGAVGVDMETSALFNVGKYRNVRVASILMASDRHPMNEHEIQWEWKMTPEMRINLFKVALDVVFEISGEWNHEL